MNDIDNCLEANGNWKITKYKRPEPDEKTHAKNLVAECELEYNNIGNNNAFSFSFIDDNFLGMKTKFFIKAPSVFLKDITEPFKKMKINIKERYKKWFCEDKDEHVYVFIDKLSSSQKKAIGKFRKKAWKYEGVDNEYSIKIYEKLVELKDEEAYYRYAKFLRKQENYVEAINFFNLAIEIYEKKDLDKLPGLYFQNAISHFKTENYSEAFLLMEKFMGVFIKNKDIDKLLFFFLLLRKTKDKNESETYLNTNRKLKNIYNSISYIIKRTEKAEISGMLIWIDLVNSTEYKENGYKEWYERILYFLNMTTAIFNILSYNTLKYIGDEVMLFKQIENNGEFTDAAKIIYDIFFDKQKWFFEEINRFNEKLTNDNLKKEQERIKVNICISAVENIIKVEDLRSKDKKYDIYGSDVDKSARIKGLARDNLVVVNERFVELLNCNKGDYSNSFNQYTWKGKMKGIFKEIKYYGKEIDQNIEFSWLKEDKKIK